MLEERVHTKMEADKNAKDHLQEGDLHREEHLALEEDLQEGDLAPEEDLAQEEDLQEGNQAPEEDLAQEEGALDKTTTTKTKSYTSISQ